MARIPWSNEEVEKLEKLYKDGKSFDDISKELNRTKNSCSEKAYKMGLQQKYHKTPLYKIDLTGQTFGKLSVIRQIGVDDNCHMLYECECNCSKHNHVIVNDYSLRTNRTKSCGCLRAEQCGKNFKKYNRYNLSGDYGIGYTSSGKEFWFDLEDYDKIKDFCWLIDPAGYVETRNRENKIEQLHRVVLGVSYKEEYKGIDVDHIGGKETRFDNRKCNLRLATRSQNNMNKTLPSNNTSGIVGVVFNSKKNKWDAQIWIDGKHICLGNYSDIEDAIKARKDAEEKYYRQWSYDNSQEIYKSYAI